MAPIHYLWFILTLAFSLTGQIFLKKGVTLHLAGSTPTMGEFLRHHLLSLALSPWVIGGVAMSGLGVVCWIYILSRFEISRALPLLGGLSYVALFVIGRLVLREPTNWLNFGGILCIIGGIFLVSLRNG